MPCRPRLPSCRPHSYLRAHDLEEPHARHRQRVTSKCGSWPTSIRAAQKQQQVSFRQVQRARASVARMSFGKGVPLA